MASAAVALLVAAGIVAAVDWWAVTADRRAVEYVCKPLTMVLLLGVALALNPEYGDRRAWFVAALVFSLVGDVLLMLPRDLFVAGLGSFLVGHICYIAGLTRHGGSAGAFAVAAVVVALAGIIPASRILPAVARRDRSMVGPVAAYMVVISAMVAAAAVSGEALALAGAVLFYVSDASIAWDRFVRDWRWARTWIMVTYHLGQAGLIASLVR